MQTLHKPMTHNTISITTRFCVCTWKSINRFWNKYGIAKKKNSWDKLEQSWRTYMIRYQKYWCHNLTAEFGQSTRMPGPRGLQFEWRCSAFDLCNVKWCHSHWDNDNPTGDQYAILTWLILISLSACRTKIRTNLHSPGTACNTFSMLLGIPQLPCNMPPVSRA